jgi:hypothetical protein
MRYLAVSLFFLITLNFSGLPELFSGLLENGSTYATFQDDADSKEKEDTKEKEEKNEKEDVKESLLAEDVFLAGLHSGPSLEIRNGILRDSGYYPEDHYPPPELS